MKSNYFTFVGTAIVMAITVLVATNCTKDISTSNENDAKVDSILAKIGTDAQCKDWYIKLKEMPYLFFPTPIPKPTNEGDPVKHQSGNHVCEEQKIKYRPEYDEMQLLDPKSEVIYVSAPMDATSVKNGAYTPLSNIHRGPVKISISLLTKPGAKPYRVIEEPSLSSVRNAVNELLHDASPGSTAGLVNFDITEVRSLEEVELGIQTNFKGWGVKVSGAYNFNSTEKKSRLLLRFYQKYYTVDMDLPNTPCDFFKPGQLPDINDFAGVSPVYVSSVTYGRMVYFMIESNSSLEETKAALSVAVRRWGMKASVDLKASEKQIIEESKMSALVVGGNADDAVGGITGLNGIIDYITSEGDFSPTSPGVPIAYTMRYLKDNSIARIILNSEYTIRNCYDLPPTSEVLYPGDIAEVRLNHIAGDTEFDGHGPAVVFEGEIDILDKRQVRFKGHLNMKEFAGYTSEGDIRIERILWTCPDDKEIIEINSAKEFKFNYIDTDVRMETFDFPESEIVKRLDLMGDTDDGDLDQADIEKGAHLHLLKFNPIKVSLMLK